MKKRNHSTRTINTKEFIVYIAFLAIYLFLLSYGARISLFGKLDGRARQTAMISVMAWG